MGICPHLSYPIIETADVTLPSTGTLYNGTSNIGSIIGHSDTSAGTDFGVFVKIECLQSECQQWDSRHNRCSKALTNYNDGDGDGVLTCADDQCTSGGGGSAASTLVQEYYGGEDLDGNGLVCGVDFYISDAPPMMSSIPQTGTSMTMQQYKDSL